MENLELGQLLFGQPFQKNDMSNIVEAALNLIGERLDLVMWNINQKEYNSPFQNTGNKFDSEVFSVHAYSWDDEIQPWNFKYGDFEVSWYKCLGRGSSMNKNISPQEVADMLDACLKYIETLDVDLDDFENV
jgi:hypothetical protein